MTSSTLTLPLVDQTGDSCCPTPAEAPLDGVTAAALADRFKALADPTRLQLLSLVMAYDSACICDLTAPVGLTQPTVSHHMKILVEAGLLRREKRGRWVHFSVIPEALADLAGVLIDPEVALARPA